MATIIHPSIVRRGVQGAFREAYDQAPIVRDRLAMTVPSTTRQEEYAWMGGPRGVEEWLGDRKAVNLPDRSFTIKNKLWEDNLPMDMSDLEDDQVGHYPILARTLGQQAAEHPDDLLFDLINNGHSSGYTAYDGAIFFSASHVEGENTAQDNDIGFTVAAANTSEPTAAECQQMADSAIYSLMSFKNWAGKKFSKVVKNLTIVVPPTMGRIFEEAFTAAFIAKLSSGAGSTAAGGSSENIWAKNYDVRIICDGRLTESSTMTTSRYVYVFNTGLPIRPFVYQVRRPFQEKYDESELFKRNKTSWGVDARYNVGYGAWWTAVRITVAT